jgi:hypothetical protein
MYLLWSGRRRRGRAATRFYAPVKAALDANGKFHTKSPRMPNFECIEPTRKICILGTQTHNYLCI